MTSPRGHACLGALLAAGLGHAQAQPDSATARLYLVRQQETDGSWSAARAAGRPEATLRVTALTLLAQIGHGSASDQMKVGIPRQLVIQEQESRRRGIQWLRRQQDAQGRIGWRADADWLLDHAIATYVLSEALRILPLPEVAPNLCKAVDVLRRSCRSAPSTAGVEVRLWAAMIARSLRAVARAEQAEPPGSGARFAAKALADTLDAMPVMAAVSAREQAAENLRAIVSGGEGKAPADAWLREPLRDPMTSFYCCTAVWLRSGKEWIEACRRMRAGVAGAQVREGQHRDSWEPVGEAGAVNGRTGTTSLALLLMQMYARRCHLEVCSGE